jgi:hypothetical protein
MKPLHELLKGKVVNCQTEEEAKEFISFVRENGYTWIYDSSLKSTLCYNYGKNTCYNIYRVYMKVSYSDRRYYERETGYEIITYQQFKQLLNENNMETKEVKIQVPEGYEIDKENSTFELIKFKPIKKVLTYEDVAEELFFGKGMCYTTYDGSIINVISCSKSEYKQPNNFTSEKQAQKLLAINRLMNVARYLNGDWQPDWSDGTSQKYYLSIKKEDSSITTDFALQKCSEVVHFKTLYLAQQAIEILGEETIKLALSTDW